MYQLLIVSLSFSHYRSSCLDSSSGRTEMAPLVPILDISLSFSHYCFPCCIVHSVEWRWRHLYQFLIYLYPCLTIALYLCNSFSRMEMAPLVPILDIYLYPYLTIALYLCNSFSRMKMVPLVSILNNIFILFSLSLFV